MSMSIIQMVQHGYEYHIMVQYIYEYHIMVYPAGAVPYCSTIPGWKYSFLKIKCLYPYTLSLWISQAQLEQQFTNFLTELSGLNIVFLQGTF